MNAMGGHSFKAPASPRANAEMLEILDFLTDLSTEIEGALDVIAPNPHMRMALFLLQSHFTGKAVTPTALIGASRVPYATARRRMSEMVDAGLIEERPRTATGKSFSMHPSQKLLEEWFQISGRVRRIVEARFPDAPREQEARDYYYGGSYAAAHSVPPLSVLPKPLKVAGGIRVLVHGDPTFMVMENLKRQFEQVIGAEISQRVFSIDRLRDEALRNAERNVSRYDIIAIDLPWIGEFAEKGVLMPIDEAMDLTRVDPADFHTAGWQAAHWNGRPFGVPAQTTPELLFYRRDMFAKAGLEPPATTEALLDAAKALIWFG